MFANLKSGEFLALVGLILLLVHNMARRQMRKSKKPVRGLAGFWLQWGDLAVFLVILAGLTLMWSQK
jgi:hypothetical protein